MGIIANMLIPGRRSQGLIRTHRRGRPAAGPRRPGQLQPAGHHLRHPRLLPRGLRASVHPELAADVRLAAVPAILMFTGMLFQHECPHWLVAQGREDEARKVLHRVRGEGDIDAEIAEVRELSERNSSFREVLRPAVRHVMIIGVRRDLLPVRRALHRRRGLLPAAGPRDQEPQPARHRTRPRPAPRGDRRNRCPGGARAERPR